MSVLLDILKRVAKAALMSLMTETFVKELIVYLLRWVSQKTTNKVDDEIVAMVERALYPEKKEEPK